VNVRPFRLAIGEDVPADGCGVIQPDADREGKAGEESALA
jgi:hypothetical protein